jgi:hypothetical protein
MMQPAPTISTAATLISLSGSTSNVAAHKQPGYAIVNISLKPIGGIPGDASPSRSS